MILHIKDEIGNLLEVSETLGMTYLYLIDIYENTNTIYLNDKQSNELITFLREQLKSKNIEIDVLNGIK